MDERHWWFAAKLQETFHFGGYDNPTLLEDFLSESEVIDSINGFLSPGQPNKLFFYCNAVPSSQCSPSPSAGHGLRVNSGSNRQLHVTSKLTTDVVSQGCVCLYVLRKEVQGEVDISQMERELFCGELRHSVLSNLASLLAEAYTPLLHSQRKWGECSEERVTNFLQSFDKLSNTLLEASARAHAEQPMLQWPSYELRNALHQTQHATKMTSKVGTLFAEILMECEALVTDWISTIEGLLLETTDERLEDARSGPLSELAKWQRRLVALTSVVEQLKIKDCKTVLAALAVTKSRLLKKWKIIDMQITDAYNNARDRVRYLEMLSPQLEALQASPPPSPSTVMTNILPALASSFKQMDGLSRAYARSGYLGIILIKISNSVIKLCMANLESYATRQGKTSDQFWALLSEAVLSEMSKPLALSSPQSKTKDHKLIVVLNSCLELNTAFREFVQQVKDSFLQQCHLPFAAGGPTLHRASNTSTGSSILNQRNSIQKAHLRQISESGNSSKMLSSTQVGITLCDVDQITNELGEFSTRMLKVLDIISTISQFRQLNMSGKLEGLPRVAGLWELCLPLDESTCVSEAVSQERSLTTSKRDSPDIPIAVVDSEGVSKTGSDSDITLATPDLLEQLMMRQKLEPQHAKGLTSQYPLGSLKEESVTSSVKSQSIASKINEKGQLEGSATISTASSSLPSEEGEGKRGYSISPTDSVALMIEVCSKNIQSKLEVACSGGVEDVFSTAGRRKAVFPIAYQEYSSEVAKLEDNICKYLKFVFAEIRTSRRALDIISKFEVISSRVALKEALHKCMLTAFSRYSLELEEIQTTYEKHKGSPPLSRNAPPIAGVVSWARQLLRRIEEPMEVFRSDSDVMESVESVHVCKSYNRLATVLLKYESLWLNQWKSSIRDDRTCMKSPLLVHKRRQNGTSAIEVNCHNQLLMLLSESKALQNLGISIPDSAKCLLAQESRIKIFRQQLEHVLEDFYSVQKSIDPPVLPLLSPHIESVVRSLLPGWTTLTWNTMNIDVFLHRVQTSIASLRELTDKVNAILKEKVYGVLPLIETSYLFDLKLATSRPWHPQEFLEVILASVMERSNTLFKRIAIIRRALLDIVALTSTSQLDTDSTTNVSSPTPVSKGKTHATSLSSTTDRERKSGLTSNKSTPQQRSSSKNVSASAKHAPSAANTVVHLATPMHQFTQLGSVEEQVLNHFCRLVSEVVVKAVLQSHDRFISCLDADQGEMTTVTTTVQSCPDVTTYCKDDERERSKLASFQTMKDSLFDGSHKSSPLPLQLMVDIHFVTPRVQLDPTLDKVHSDLLEVSEILLRVLHQVKWWVTPYAGRSLYDVFGIGYKEEAIYSIIRKSIQNVSPGIKKELKDLQQYDFLWQQDLHSSYSQFLDSKPGQKECCLHVESLLQLEKDLENIPDSLPIGPLLLSTEPVKNSFKAWAVAWKIEFLSFLHNKAKTSLESLVSDREAMVAQLNAPVETLHQLKATLELLHHITDLQNVIDNMYYPVEELYQLLRVYNPTLPRIEVQQVDSLRDEWDKLISLADSVRHRLLSDQRIHYEREIDKQVKAFVVETIQFRNSFDTEGPLVPGLLPSEAVSRLGSFLERCEELQEQHSLLDAAQKLLDIPITPYPELEQTEQDLSYLRALYSNYQNFIAFDKRFRQELWAEVDLEAAKEMVEGFWSIYESLPVEQKEWDASRKLRTEIEHYLQFFPLLKQLHSREIRNRHWLQVMNVANCTFQLEGSIFKMTHLLDAGLLLHATAIQGIIHCAQCELELEEQFYKVEEEWSEQVLTFQPYKPHGNSVLLNVDQTHSLIEQLENTQIQLATMLKSKYIQPLREEAAQWAARLACVSEILQKWLQVQELWHNLEVVFNNPTTSREFPEEAVKFASIHKQWLKLMKTTYQTKNILQCCTGGDVPKSKLLNDIGQDLELCKKSLTTYLLSKRKVFPRFYFVSDDSLLSILSNSVSVESVKPHLGSLFNNVGRIVSTNTNDRGESLITGVESCEGEILPVNQPVPLNCGAEQWMSQLLVSTHSTLHDLIIQAVDLDDSTSFSLEECAHSCLTQVANMALYFRWTRECEQALVQCRYDRRALPGTKNKFNTWAVSKLSHLLMRNSWKLSDEPISRVQRIKLESLAMLSVWLRDIVEDLCRQKLRDITDFEWQKYIRPQLVQSEEEVSDSDAGQCQDGEEANNTRPISAASISLQCLDRQLSYGFEYQGCRSLPVMTPRRDNYIIAFTQGIQSHLGSMLIGPAGSGKVQLIKGIGQLCGRFVLSTHCCSLTDKRAVARMFEGLAQDGCWSCFCDVQQLPPSTLSTLSQMMQVISAALQSKKEFCTFPSGREITLSSNVAVFLTHTDPSSVPQWQLPPTISPFFRTFSLPLPDPAVVFRAHCMALGLKASKALANKLANLQTMARNQLSSGCSQASLSTSSLCHILKIASARKFVVQRTADSSHLTSQTSDHALNTKLSSTSRLPPQASTVGHTPSHNVPDSKFRRKQSVSNLTLSPAGGQQLPPSVVKEQSLIAQLIMNMIGARLPDKELSIFTSMVKDVFGGVDLSSSSVGLKEPFVQDMLSASLPMAPTASTKMLSPPNFSFVSDLLRQQAKKNHLVVSPRWMAKVEQLFIQSQLKHAVIVAGRPATGKSSALNTVVSTLNALQGSDSSNIKLVKVYPDTYESLSDLFGCVTQQAGDWVDGIFTSIFRKAHKATQSVTWVCLDGAMSSPWMQFLPELLGQSKTLSLANGEHLVMKERNFKLLFETGNLNSASPVSLLNCGVLYFDCGVLGWRPVVEAWRATRTLQESKCLKKYFEQVMDSIVDFILNKSGKGAKYSEVGLLETCLAYLTALLDTYTQTAEVFSEVHVERLLLFSIIWSYGGVLVSEKEQKKFSHLLKTLTNSLPDDDSEFSVFDYYVDESGEWDVWQSRMPVSPVSQVDMLGRVFVDTTETIRVEVLLELALASKRNVLLCGPHGGGKTTICRHFLQSRAMINGGTEILKQVVFNKTTNSDSLHNFMMVNFHHRQGYSYGPKHGKTMQLFVDDLHLSLTHCNSMSDEREIPHCSSHEYLRQLIDIKGLYNLEKKNEWCVVEDLVIFASLTTSSDALVEPRLRRHLATIHIPELQDHNLSVVTYQQLAAILENSVNEDILEKLVSSSITVYKSVKGALNVSDMPGRHHYFFSLRYLESVFQGLCQCAKISGGLQVQPDYCWSHEIKRAFTDCFCRCHDREWFQHYIDSLAQQLLPTSLTTDNISPTVDNDANKDSDTTAAADSLGPAGKSTTTLALTAIPIEVKQGEEQPSSAASPLHTLPSVTLQPLNDWSDLKPSITHFIRRYQEEHGDQFSMNISTEVLKHLVKLHRTLRFTRGNCVLVGSLGQPLKSMAQIALYIAGYELQLLDSSSESKFKESFRVLFRQTGLEGKALAIIITEKDLASPLVADTLNSVMSCGELPTLYTNDEMDGLLQALTPSIKRDFPSEETDPMQYFTARIYRNLRIVICLSPNSPLLHKDALCYKGMLQNCQLIWMCDWTTESLMNTTCDFFSSNPLAAVNIDNKHRTPLYNCLAAIHHYLLQETGQLCQAGLQPGRFEQPNQLPQDVVKNDDNIPSIVLSPPQSDKHQASGLRNAPASMDYLMEKVLDLDSIINGNDSSANLKLPYLGPRTYLQFMECFCEIYKKKSIEANSERENLTKALKTLQKTFTDAEQMKKTLRELQQKHEDAGKLSNTLLTQLTTKSCQVERLKALLGQGSSVLSAIQMVREQERLLIENENDDEELLAVFMDRKSSRLETLLQKARDHFQRAEAEKNDAKKCMLTAKEKATHWQNKIDRNTIDQIKTLNNPPYLVGTIMELMLTLLWQHGSNSQEVTPDGSAPGYTAITNSLKRKSSTMVSGSTRMEREQWNTIQLAIGDSQKFLDLLNGLKWENGLSADAVNLIKSRLAMDEESTGGGQLESSGSSRSSTGTKPSELITISMARYAAESAAHMCAFAVAIVKYNESFKPYMVAKENFERAKRELEEIESSLHSDSSGQMKLLESGPKPELEDVDEEAEVGEEGLAKVQAELNALQEQFDRAVIDKHSLGETCQQLAEKLKSVNHLLESLRARRDSWQSKLQSLPSVETVMANCILAATFTSCCGALKTVSRLQVFDSLLAICRSCGFPPANTEDKDNLLTLKQYPEFMAGKPALYHLIIEGLSLDATSMESACLITYDHSQSWPLILDRSGMVESWLNYRLKNSVVMKYSSPDFDNSLLKCVTEGATVIVTQVDVVDLSSNKLQMDLLQSRSQLYQAKSTTKIVIDGSEVECNPDFKLFLVTSDHLSIVSPVLFSVVTVVEFQPERKGIEELLLDSFLELQNAKTYSDREELRKELHTQSARIEDVERQLLELIANEEEGQIEDPKSIKSILTLNKAFEDAQESFKKAQDNYTKVNTVHLSLLRSLASQASVITDVVLAMGSILPAYNTSYNYIKAIFVDFVKQIGSLIQGEDSLAKMTKVAYSHFSRGYFEKDRLLFSLMLTTEIEINAGRATKCERNFLVTPSPGSSFVVKGLVSQASMLMEIGNSVPALNFGRKPFDWMSDAQWQTMLTLASHFSWVHEILERLGKDGKEAVWRTVGEGVAPEIIDITEGLGYRPLPMRQLLLMFAMRPERITQCAVSFVTTVLDSGLKQRKLNYYAPIEISYVAKTLKTEEIPLILYRVDPVIFLSKLQRLADKLEVKLVVVSLHGAEEVTKAKKAIREASSNRHWVLLNNIHTSPELLSSLPAFLETVQPMENWKLWLSSFGDCDQLPVHLLHSAYKIVLDSPLSLRGNVLHSLSCMAGDLITASARPEWLPILHNMIMLHATLRLRKLAFKFAWAENYHWTLTHLFDILAYLRREFKNSEMTPPGTSGVRPISWYGLRYMITEVFYGSTITDPVDNFNFAALTEHWMHAGGPKRESGRYHTPSQFFTPKTKLTTLILAVENASPPLAFTAELCGLHYTPIITLGWRDYLFPLLAQLSKYLEEQSPGSYVQCAPSRKELTATTRQPSVSNMSVQSTGHGSQLVRALQAGSVVGVHTTRLPSFIPIPYPIADMALVHVSSPVLREMGHSPVLWSDLPLQATVEKLIDSIPTAWKKEVLVERLKKLGPSNSEFVLFMKAETSKMCECLNGIHESLQDLQATISNTVVENPLTDLVHLVDLALSLLLLKVPRHWIDLVGPTAPPASWPLKEWVQDLVLRFVFLDRVLITGLPRTPTYWLGAFFNPCAFLSIIQQTVIKSLCSKSGAVEQYTIIAELTSRDKDHVRDPPPEGELFVYGVYLWGCGYEKATNLDLQDLTPKTQVPTILPVLHLSVVPQAITAASESQGQSGTTTAANATSAAAGEFKGPHVHHCPCFVTNSERNAAGEVLFSLTVTNSEVTPLKWATRNLVCTLRPF